MNNIITSKMAGILSLEMAKKAAFLKVGSKDYFADQLKGKRNGRTYEFVIPDAGNVVEGLVASPRDIEEKKVDVTLKNFNNSVRWDALEGITDLKWEEEIAESWAGKLMNKILKTEVEAAMPKVTTGFVGKGFKTLSKAGKYLQSIVNEDLYGFIDPQLEAVITSNGQQFVPAGNPNDLYAKGKLGRFQNVDYTAERWVKPFTMGASLEGAKVNGDLSETVTSGSCSLSIDGISASGKVKAGTPIWVDGVFACDTIGDETNTPYCFIVKEDTDITSSAATVKVEPFIFEDVGARSISTSATDNLDVKSLEAGKTYYRGLIRANGSYCYTPLNEMDFALSENASFGSTDGIKVIGNSFTDGTSAINMARVDSPYMAGTVEPRANTCVFVEAEV